MFKFTCMITDYQNETANIKNQIRCYKNSKNSLKTQTKKIPERNLQIFAGNSKLKSGKFWENC